MIVVVPPNAAARVPVSKVSFANVPPNGSSMCVCGSIPPGITHLPVASMVRSAVTSSDSPMMAIRSPSMRTSPVVVASALTIVPPVISVRIRSSSHGDRSRARVGLASEARPAPASARREDQGLTRSPYISGRRSR